MPISAQSYALLQRVCTKRSASDEAEISAGASIEDWLASKKVMPACPRCGSTKLVKNGRRQGRQRFKCKACGQTLGWSSQTPFYRSRMPYDTWSRFIQQVERRTPLREIAEECGISLHTACKWRQRYLDGHLRMLMEVLEELQAKGMIKEEADLSAVGLLLDEELKRVYRGKSKLVAQKRFLNWQQKFLAKLEKQNGGATSE